MKLFLILVLIFASIACRAGDNEDSPQPIPMPTPVPYDPAVHKLGDAGEWNKIRQKILFNNVFQAPALLSPAGKRGEDLDAETVLHTLHSWFSEGAGYTMWDDGTSKVLTLRPIPPEVLREIYSRTSEIETGFGFLDTTQWRTIQELQNQNYEIAIIDQYPSPIAGFNNWGEKLIALDVLANSGTLTHERRHQTQHELLGKPVYWGKLTHACKAKLSDFFAEYDATTVQLPNWIKVINNDPFSFQVKNLAQYEMDGGDLTIPSLMAALGANLEYPISKSSVVLKSDDSQDSYFSFDDDCPDEIKNTVTQILNLLTKEKISIEGSPAADVLKGKYRREAANILRQQKQKCDGVTPTPDSCGPLATRLQEIHQAVEKAQSETSQKLVLAYRERTEGVSKIILNLPQKEIREMCREVMGIALMIPCGEYR